MITIIGLGPGPIDDLSLRAWNKLQETDTLYLRTRRHPCVVDLPAHLNCISFDDIYEAHDSFDDVYRAIAEQVLQVARGADTVVYAVPGDPFVGEATVTLIRKQAAVDSLELEIVSGISFIEPCLASLGIDALEGIQVLDGLEVASQYHPPINPAKPALMAQVYDRAVATDLKLTLMNQYPDDFPVRFVHGSVTGNATVEDLSLFEIDRSSRIDVLTTLYLPALDPLSSFEAFQDIIAHLRSAEGCPWDRKQTHESLRPFLIEEAHEVLETIDTGDALELREELGDLLLQVVLHAQIAIDDGEFYMKDILQHLNKKMIRRHPHVWGDVDVQGDPQRVSSNWEDIKKEEQAIAGKQRSSLLEGVPKGMPSLLVAHRYSRRASKVGFDWDDISGVEQKAKEEFEEIFAASSREHRAQEIGDLIFVLVNWLRWLDVDDPESLLRETNAKFHRRFSFVEASAARQNRALTEFSLDELDTFWQDAKRAGL